MTVLPVYFYLKNIGYDNLQKEKISEAQNNSQKIYKEEENFGKSIKHLPRSLWLLVRKKTFLYLAFFEDIWLICQKKKSELYYCVIAGKKSGFCFHYSWRNCGNLYHRRTSNVWCQTVSGIL